MALILHPTLAYKSVDWAPPSAPRPVPDDVLTHVMAFLPDQTLLAVGTTCKRLNDAAQSGPCLRGWRPRPPAHSLPLPLPLQMSCGKTSAEQGPG